LPPGIPERSFVSDKGFHLSIPANNNGLQGLLSDLRMEIPMRNLISAKLLGGFALASVFLFLASPVKAGPITLLVGDFTKMKFTDFDHIIKGSGNTGPGLQAGDTLEGVFFVTDIGSTTNSTLLNGQLATKQLTGYFHISVGSSPFPGHLSMALNAGDQISFYTNSPNTFKDSGGVSIAADIIAATSGTPWTKSLAGDMPLGDISVNGFTGTISANTALNFSINNTGYVFQDMQYFAPPIDSDAGLDAQISPLTNLPADHNAKTAGWQFRSEDPVTVFVSAVPEPSSMVLLGVGGLAFAGILFRRRSKPVV
jgi:hypothetical protein